MNEVRLVDLEIIKRYSLAIRQETAPADELLAVLDATREAIAASMKPATPAKAPRKTARKKAAS
jgi:hypothetical protein